MRAGARRAAPTPRLMSWSYLNKACRRAEPPALRRSGPGSLGRTFGSGSPGPLGRRRLARRPRGCGGGLSGRTLGVHEALAAEDAALLDHQDLGGDVPVDPAAPCQLGLSLHEDVPLEPAGHGHAVGADVGLDLALRAQHDVALGVDLALHLAVDAKRAGGHERPLELGP